MGDLISRSQLLKEIENWGGCVEALQEYISNMPTAFDAEKIVAELEEASHWEEPTFDEDGYCNDDSWEVVYLDKATEIVRKGGAE